MEVDTIAMLERASGLVGAGDTTGAERICREVLQHESDNPDAHYLLGVIAHQRGDNQNAEKLISQAIASEPAAFWYRAALAEVRTAREDLNGAIESLQAAIRLQPDQRELYEALAKLFGRARRLEECIQTWQTLAQRLPDDAGVLNNLGASLLALRRSRDAITPFRRAVELNPKFADAWRGLAISLADDLQAQPARQAINNAIALAPDDATMHFDAGIVLLAQKDQDGALDAFLRAIEKNPSHVEAHLRAAYLLAMIGDLDGAIARWQRATEIAPAHPAAYRRLLFNYNFDPNRTREQTFAAHKQWGESFMDPQLKLAPPHFNPPEPDRRIRVGYVSGDLRYHAVAMFFRPILEHHHRERFESICFQTVATTDSLTQTLRGMSDGWHEVKGMPPKDVADLIRRERIDILVDLGGLAWPAFLDIFALKPAPVQMSYLGYCNTSGMRAFDYVFGDEITDPPDDTQPYVEQLVRLPGCFACYAPVDAAPEVSELPARSNGFVTLGSFHALRKINSRVLDLWARILKFLPAAKLLMLRDRLSQRAQDRLWNEFTKRGISADRLIMDSRVDENDPMKLRVYDRADIALDAFPWSGHTTSCNALWMGVPYVTLRWPTHAGRMAASAITHAGFPQWVADNEDEYVRIVTDLCSDLNRLAELRRTLRQRLAASRLCDGRAFVIGWEKALRDAWRAWCRNRATVSN